MIKKNKFLGTVGKTKVEEILGKVKQEQTNPARKFKSVYEVWGCVRPKGKEGAVWIPTYLTIQLKGMLKQWAKYVNDFGYDPVEVLKVLIEDWLLMKTEMYWLGSEPNVHQLVKSKSEMLNYYIANKPKKIVPPADQPVTKLVTNSVNATNCTDKDQPPVIEEGMIVKRKGNIVIRKPSNEPDSNCFTLPNGECVSTKPCMHTPGYFDTIHEGDAPQCLVDNIHQLEDWYKIEKEKVDHSLNQLKGMSKDDVASKKQRMLYGKVLLDYSNGVEKIYQRLKEKLAPSENPVKLPPAVRPAKGIGNLDDELDGEDLDIPDYE
jgi:hypothetical protein